jgi:metallophosphoesterase (TIGR00282 family)
MVLLLDRRLSLLKILFIGDIVGRPGRRIVKAYLQDLIQTELLDLVIANGENSAGGFGINREIFQELLAAGVDVITMGNHTWDNKEIYQLLERERRIVRPANYPGGTPGEGYYIAQTQKGVPVGVVNILGQVFLEPLACPFQTATEYIADIKKKTNIIIIDFHAEATSEKAALGWYLDGKATAVLGTHTHITTADERVLPKGTGYITDVGMTGPSNSILGIDPDIIIKKFITHLPARFEVASGPVELNGVILEIDDMGTTKSIRRIKRTIDN